MKNCPNCKERKRIALDDGRSTLKKKLLSAAGGQLLKCQSCGTEFTYFGRTPVTPVPSTTVETDEGHASGDELKEEYGELIRKIEQAELTSGLLVPVQEQAPDDGAVIERDGASEAVEDEPSDDGIEVPSMMTKTLEIEIDALEISPETSAGEEEPVAPDLSQEIVRSEIHDEVEEVDREELPLAPSKLGFEQTGEQQKMEEEVPLPQLEDIPLPESAPPITGLEEDELIEQEPTLIELVPEPEEQETLEEAVTIPVKASEEEPLSVEQAPLNVEAEQVPKPPARPRTLKNYDSLSLFPRRREPERKGSK